MAHIVKRKNGSGKYGKHLYHVSVKRSIFGGYDTYSAFVACADSEEEVRKMHPDRCLDENDVGVNWHHQDDEEQEYSSWIAYEDMDKLDVKFLGDAIETVKGVILSSYHAG
jgi:hypothetical protein